MRSVLLSTVSVILSAVAVSAQQPAPCLERDVLVSIVANKSGSLSKLSPSDFRAETQHRPVVINSIRSGPDQRRAVLVLDMSGSMAGTVDNPKWSIATTSAKAIVAAIPEQWPIALVTVAKQVEIQASFTTSHAALAQLLETYSADRDLTKGKTALLDGIWKALELLQPRQLADTIYVVTDGGDNASQATFTKIQRELAASSVKLAVILITDRVPRTEEEKAGPPAFADLARQTGGWRFWIDDALADQQRAAANARMISMLAGDPGIILHVRLPGKVERWQSWQLELVDEKGHKRKQFIVNYPQKLGPCH